MRRALTLTLITLALLPAFVALAADSPATTEVDYSLPRDLPPFTMPPETLVPTTLPPPPAYARCPQWWSLAREVGWPEEWMPTFDRVMWRESRCRTTSWNKSDSHQGSLGLMQVNSGWRPWLEERGILVKYQELFDPETNLRAALAVWHYSEKKNGWGWAQWYIPKNAEWCEFPGGEECE